MNKILIVNTVGFSHNGISHVIVSYLESMQLDGLEIYIAETIFVDSSIREQLENLGCVFIPLPNRRKKPIRYFCKLTHFIRTTNINIIHAHGNSGTMAVEMMAAWVGGCKKRLAHSHNTKCEQKKADKVLRPLFYLLYTDGLACGEEAGKWLFQNRKFEVLANGRDIEKYKFRHEERIRIRKSLGIENELAIGHVGGFFEQKNHKFLVEIYKELRKLEPQCKLFMIGDGPLRAETEEMCVGLDVKFTGAIDNIPDYLNAMDGMLLPSLFEGLPLVAIEWQINGLPCILSNVITPDCKIMDCLKFKSLEEPACDWAEMLIEMIKQNNREANAKESYALIENSQFNIYNGAKRLEEIYKS